MGATLSEIPAAKRRQVAAVLGLFSALLVAIGVVAVTGSSSGLLTVFASIAFVAALLLALLAWGVLASVKNERDAQRDEAALDAAVARALSEASDTAAVREFAAHGCGHQHDPDELHVTDDPCEHDGGGAECSRSCDTCVLARLRPDGARPRPMPLRPT